MKKWQRGRKQRLNQWSGREYPPQRKGAHQPLAPSWTVIVLAMQKGIESERR